jgi:hypothetical protein
VVLCQEADADGRAEKVCQLQQIDDRVIGFHLHQPDKENRKNTLSHPHESCVAAWYKCASINGAQFFNLLEDEPVLDGVHPDSTRNPKTSSPAGR